MLMVKRVSKEKNMRGFSRGFLLAGIVLSLGCKDKKVVEEMPPDTVEEAGEIEIRGNALEGLPGEVYKTQFESAIKWHPWTKETLEKARISNRLILAMVVLPQQPAFLDVLSEMNLNKTLVNQINDDYVPVLIDGDAVREIGILTGELCAEIGKGLQLPLLVWITHEANPVAWIPLSNTNPGSVGELFEQSHEMVGKMWDEDPSYISRNSMLDQGNRRDRMKKRRDEREVSVDPASDAVRALRQLTSLYDPVSRTFDEAGGLFPCGAIDLLAMGSRLPGLPEELQQKSRMVLENLVNDLLVSPMFDPLDGGAYSSRRRATWSLPGYYRDCATQARIIVSLLDSYEVTGDQRALDRAMGVMGFIENNYETPVGLFGLGAGVSGNIDEWLWRLEDVEEILSGGELDLWVAFTGMKSMGNLPSEVDPVREYFRANTIGFVKSAEELAEEKGGDVKKIEESLDSARRKLLKARDERVKASNGLFEANAVATFRMVSAYASAYRITGKEDFLKRAVDVLGKAKKHFSDGPFLRLYASDAAPSVVAGRAFIYGLAVQAALDVAAVTFDDNWLMWADDLATTTVELFLEKEYLRECPMNAKLMDLPITDIVMLFDESTAGVISMAESRLEALGRPLLKSFSDLATPLPMRAIDNPILHTDVIQASLMRSYGETFVYGSQASAEIKMAIARSPFKGVNRRSADSGSQPNQVVEADQVILITADKNIRQIQSVRDLGFPVLRN
ncbi:MAG: thioredoxin domain-containing protein [Armatimonadetes bacterium]|nr:thioredoxin domain-containing protein [Akkermansiaceae bacterium]